jgi:anaerobic ribonucleoside-triphosphate reductase activating protein
MFKTSYNSIRVHSRLNKSRANGPGNRAVIWMQGCPFDCPGCFNPGLKDFKGGRDVPVEDLIEWAVSIEGIEGISISGGEPTEQLQPLNRFLTTIKEKTDLSVLLFSGRTEKDIIKLAGGRRLMAAIDILIEGLYKRELSNPHGIWPSSKNQKIRVLSKRYNKDDFFNLPETEIIITEQGEVVESGLGIMNIF